jgi:hypothetical protein
MMPAVAAPENIVSSFDMLADPVPEVIEGYRAIRSVIESDGALSVAEKALLVAADDAVCSDGQLARQRSRAGEPPA